MIIIKSILATAILFFTGCATKDLTSDIRYSFGLHKGDILATKVPTYFVKHPGGYSVSPTDIRSISNLGTGNGTATEHVVEVLPSGTKIQFRGVLEVTYFMANSHYCFRGKILDGRFKGKTADIRDLLDPVNETLKPPYLRGVYLEKLTP
jgi:hypothetical protein